MAIPFVQSIDMTGLQIMNFVVHSSAVAPDPSIGGMMWWDNVNFSMKHYDDNESMWLSHVSGPSSSTNGLIPQWNGSLGNKLSEGLTLRTILRTSASADDESIPSEKAVRDAIGNVRGFRGAYDADQNVPDLDISPNDIMSGDMYNISTNGIFFSVEVEAGDFLVANRDNPTAENHWTILQKNLPAIIPVAQGGTGLNGINVLNGQLLIGNDIDNNFSLNLPSATNGITVTSGPGTLTFSADIPGLTEALALNSTDSFMIYNGSHRRITLATLLSYTGQGGIGSGDTLSASLSANHSIARYDGINNKTIQDSQAFIDDSGNVSAVGDVIAFQPSGIIGGEGTGGSLVISDNILDWYSAGNYYRPYVGKSNIINSTIYGALYNWYAIAGIN